MFAQQYEKNPFILSVSANQIYDLIILTWKKTIMAVIKSHQILKDYTYICACLAPFTGATLFSHYCQEFLICCAAFLAVTRFI